MAPIPQRPDSGAAPASYAQKALWILDRLWPDKCVYNTPSLWRLIGTLDVEALRLGIQTLSARHETLRTRFEISADEPVQVIEPPSEDGVAGDRLERDAAGRPRASRPTAHRRREPRTLRPRDGSAAAGQLLRLASEEHLLLLDVHHIVADGWSVGVLCASSRSAVHRRSRPAQPRLLPALPIQYADYAVWQREWLQGAALEAAAGLLDGATGRAARRLELPTDRPRPAVPSYRGAQPDL